MIARVKCWLALAGGFLMALLAAWSLGRREGAQRARADRAERNVEAAQEAKEVRHEIENSDDARLHDILTGRMRR